MPDTLPQSLDPVPSVELIQHLSDPDMADLCDATDAAIEAGGGFGWVELPSREIMERWWRGVVTMPHRDLFVARLDGVICGTVQLVKPPMNNQAQAHITQLLSLFVTPWGRSHGLFEMLIDAAEKAAIDEGFKIMNLDVRETMITAIEKYEAAGYVRIGEHPHYAEVDGETLRGYYYYKDLLK